MGNPSVPYTLETVTGKFVDLVDPDPADICIEDIAWSLSRLARFNGHTIQAIPYSVAQHSCVVASEIAKGYGGDSEAWGPVRARMVLLGLLHDASEAYTGDVSGPLKKIPEFRPIIKKLEHNIQDAIYKALNIIPPNEEEERIIIKPSDLLSQRIEAYNFMNSRGQNWTNQPNVSIVKLQEFEMPIPSLDSYNNFLQMYEEQQKILQGK